MALELVRFKRIVKYARFIPGIISTSAVLELAGHHYDISCLKYLEYANGIGVIPVFCLVYLSLAINLCNCQRIHLAYAFFVGVYAKLVTNSVIPNISVISASIIYIQIPLILLINWRHYASWLLYRLSEFFDRKENRQRL